MDELQAMGGEGVAAALASRQARLDDLAAGATPRALQGIRELNASALGGGGVRVLTQDQIHDIFDFYANFGRSAVMSYQDSMDNFMFMKFAKECPGLIDPVLNKTEIDLIFTKAKPKFERRLDFEHFLDALAAIAERKNAEYSPADGLRLLIANHLAPHYDIVQVEMQKTGDTEIPLTGVFKKLYDPRSYTGVYAERFRTGDGRINGEADNRPGRGYRGSTNTGTNEIIHDISVLMRPNLQGGGTMMAPANHTLYKRDPSTRSRSPSQSRIHSPSRPGSAASPRPRSTAGSVADGDRSRASFASPGPRGSHAPTPASTPAAPPTVASLGLDAATLSDALARAQAGDATSLMSLTAKLAEAMKTGGGSSASSAADGGVAPSPAARRYDASSLASGTIPALSQEQIKEIFEFYANFGRSSVMTYQESMDNFMFMKFAKECPDLLDRGMNKTEVDLIFTKAKPKFERRLHFSHFLDALSAVAERKYPEYSPTDGLRLLIGNHLLPLYEIVQVEMQKTGDTEIPLTGIFKKLYDPRSYTGVYAERFRTGDGRINGEADNRPGRGFRGSTNSGTDETIHDISVLMRPNLRSGSMMTNRPVAQGGSPRRASGVGASPRRPGSPGGDGRSVTGSLRSGR
jgi:hypothetical protein